MSSRTQIILLADEWKSSKGGLSTMNRELAIQFAKHPNVAVTFFVPRTPRCTEDDKKAASSHGISIVEAKERSGFEPTEWLCFPSSDLAIDIIIGHGVKLGKQAQVIRETHHCTWVQVVHTAPDKLAMFKSYSGAISEGNKKQWTEVNLCKIADHVVAVGPKLHDIYSRYLSRYGKNVFNLTPGIFNEFSDLKPSPQGSKEFWILVFGRGDSEDFGLKGFDIAAKAVAELNDESYQLVFVGAPSENEEQVAKKLLDQGLKEGQLTVKEYLENRDDLATLLSAANLAIIPSRTEGFGLTALEALSAGLPFLVSQKSGFAEALQEVPFSSSWMVNSDDPKQWAKAIKGVREKGSEIALKECQELRTRYAKKYSWEKQCNDIVEMLVPLVNVSESEVEPAVFVPSQNSSEAVNEKTEKNAKKEETLGTLKGEGCQEVSIESPEHLTGVLKDKLEMPQPNSVSVTEGKRLNGNSVETSRRTSPLQEDQPGTEQREDRNSSDIRPVIAMHSQGARPKETPASSNGKTKLKELAILGCNVSENSMQAARKVFQYLVPKVNLAANPPVENLPPVKVKQYLTGNHLKFCVLVVDAERVKDAYGNPSQRRAEYEELLKTAANAVDEKVVVLICNTSFKSKDDEAIVGQTIERIINEKGIGCQFSNGILLLILGRLLC